MPGVTGPLRRWSAPMDLLTALWSSAAVAPVSTGAAAAYRTMFATVRRLVVGRRLTIGLDDGSAVRLTVTGIESRLDVRALAVGQLGDVRVDARDIRHHDIRHGDNRFDRATALAHDVGVRPGVPPVLVAGPVELTLEIPTRALDTLIGWAAPRFAGEVGADAVARLRLTRRPGWGQLEVDAALDGQTLLLTPRAVLRGRRRWRLPAFAPAYPVRLPDLPHGLILTGVAFAPGLVSLTATLPRWQTELPGTRWENLLTGLL
jgi:hypothetical protein